MDIVRSSLKRPALLILAAVAILAHIALLQLLGQIVVAQGPLAQYAEQLQTTIVTGDIYEIVALSDMPEARHSWVLTRNRQFIEAGRERYFHFRPVEPGMYTLQAEVSSPDGSVRYRRVFTITVQARLQDGTFGSGTVTKQHIESGSGSIFISDLPPPQPGESLLVATNPAVQQGNIFLDADREVVVVTPRSSSVGILSMDFNAELDTDGDGNPGNDPDSEKLSVGIDLIPLYVWLATPGDERQMQITAQLRVGTQAEERLRLVRVAQGPAAQLGEINVQNVSEGVYMFSLKGNPATASGAAMLTYWDFGDATQSLLTEPTHTYKESSSYTVRVSVRDLATGRELMTAERSIGASAEVPSTETGAVVPPVGEEPTNEPVGSGRSAMGLIIRIMLVALGSILAGVVLVFGIVLIRKRMKKLPGTLEVIEAKLVDKDATKKQIIDTPAAPMELKTPAAPAKTPVAPPSPPKPTTPAPSPAPQPSPAPAPAPPVPADQPLAAQKPATAFSAPATSTPVVTPAYQKPSTQPTAPKSAPSLDPVPQLQKPAVPTPTQTASTAPATTPEKTPTVSPWLQEKPAVQPSTQAPTPTPVTPPAPAVQTTPSIAIATPAPSATVTPQPAEPPKPTAPPAPIVQPSTAPTPLPPWLKPTGTVLPKPPAPGMSAPVPTPARAHAPVSTPPPPAPVSAPKNKDVDDMSLDELLSREMVINGQTNATPKTQEQPKDDPTIGIIRVESLDDGKKDISIDQN